MLALGERLGHGNFETKGLYATREFLGLDGWVTSAIEVVGSWVHVQGAIGEEMPYRIEHGVCDSDGCPIGSPAFSDTGILG